QPRDLGGHRGDARRREEPAQRQLDAERLAHAGDGLGGEERVAAEREEVVFDTDPVDAEQLLPDREQPLPGEPPGGGSRRRSTLPFGVIGRASSSTKADGIM